MRRALLALAVVAVALLGGCGIPDNSDVQVLGPAPSSGTSSGDDDTPPEQFGRDATTDPSTFIDYYLQAAAGDPAEAVTRVKSFMSPQAQATFKPTPDIRVVRPLELPLITPGSNDVKLTVQVIGTLQDDGQLLPSEPTTTTLTLVIALVPGKGLFVTVPPPVLYLSDTGLTKFYEQRPIYFWNTDDSGLVPDVRYLPLTIRKVQQTSMILNWLASGPADWLHSAVHPLPQGAVTTDVPVLTNDRLQISLGAQAVQPPGDEKALDRLRRQLQWSLRQLVPRKLELTIGHQSPVSFVDQPFVDSNAAARLADTPDRFVIFNGVIRRPVESPHATDPVPLLKPEANRGIQAAAMATSTTHTFAAVVTGKSLQVAAAPTGTTADLRPVRGLSGPPGQPAWAVTAAGAADAAIGLVTVRGRLYSFGSGSGARAEPVEWQNGDPGPLTAVSVAPDGHRVVVVSGGRLYRTVLTVGGDGVGGASPDPIWPATLTSVSAVAWSSEGWLTVAGVRASDNRVTIMDVSIDGAESHARLRDIGTQPVTALTAYPANPLTATGTRIHVSSAVSYVADAAAWDVLSEPVKITPADLAGPAATPPAGATPTAPFFLN